MGEAAAGEPAAATLMAPTAVASWPAAPSPSPPQAAMTAKPRPQQLGPGGGASVSRGAN